MEETVNAEFIAAQISGTVYYISIGIAADKGLGKLCKFAGIIFKIRILHYDQITGSCLKAMAQGCAFAHITLMEEQYVYLILQFIFQKIPGPVRRTVINNHYLGLHSAFADLVKNCLYGLHLVVTGNDNRYHQILFS